MLPSPPETQILQYLAFCSIGSGLVYYQRKGPYLKHYFLISGSLLGLMCVSCGTETMLRFLPLVMLVTLLASCCCQVFTEVLQALQPHEVDEDLLATPEPSFKTMGDEESVVSVT